jgi:hypothetical protein
MTFHGEISCLPTGTSPVVRGQGDELSAHTEIPLSVDRCPGSTTCFCPPRPSSFLRRSEPAFFHAEIVGSPHSVLTARLVDEAGHPTIEARDAVISPSASEA